MFIDKIKTAEKQLLLIKSEKTNRLYEWLSEAWEPLEGVDGERIIISEETHVQGILLSDKSSY